MSFFGTKCCNDSAHNWSPETIGSIYQEIIQEHGNWALNKPKPGNYYSKRYHPLEDVERAYFKRLPGNIIVTSPPRLFRSHGYKYKGRIYLECECHWTFDYKYPWGDGWKFDVMPVRLLSWCYINHTVHFPKTIIQAKQLSLF